MLENIIWIESYEIGKCPSKMESFFHGKGPIGFPQLPSELTNSNENFPNLYHGVLANITSSTYIFGQTFRVHVSRNRRILNIKLLLSNFISFSIWLIAISA